MVVTVAVAVPLLFPLVAVIVVVPVLVDDAVNAANDELIVVIIPTVISLFDHVIVTPVNWLPYWSFGVAVKYCEPPSITDTVCGDTAIDVNTGGADVTVTVAVPLIPPLIALIVTLPVFVDDAVNIPVDEPIAPIVVSLLDHVIVIPVI